MYFSGKEGGVKNSTRKKIAKIFPLGGEPRSVNSQGRNANHFDVVVLPGSFVRNPHPCYFLLVDGDFRF